jgi:hypothetical protein
MGTQKVKGSVLKSRLAFVEKKSGAEGLDRVIGNLDPEDQKALRGLIPVAWLCSILPTARPLKTQRRKVAKKAQR